jgi:dimethylhistidine N-methyltransferase
MRQGPSVTDSHAPQTSLEQFASDVQYYLTLYPRQLPSRYFYDALGSALFEAICRLPWYRVTRAELRLLEAHGREIFEGAGRLTRIVELGSGSGDKLATLVESGRSGAGPLDLHLIDVSPSALAVSSRALSALDDVHVVTHEASYEAGLLEATREAWGVGPTLVLFLGSNIGNFDRPGAEAFLRGIRARLARGDALLIGADLVKGERELLLAYDDPLGVTAAFNRNLLTRVNRELGADFDIERFAHRAVWNREESRVEMHLVSLARQRVRIPAAEIDVTIEERESIWTESSYKYQPDDIVRTLEQTGFACVGQWIDDGDGFALTLVKAA